MLLLSAFLVGLVAGLRSMLAPAIVSWFARLDLLKLGNTYVALMSYLMTAVIFTVLAVCELVVDKLPKTPSRKQPLPFTIRILSGALVGATVGATGGKLVPGIFAGALGAVVGTLGGAAARAKLAVLFGRDFRAAILEDLVGIAIALFAILRVA
ncbi:MAG TPA: DUF4126 family protein [Acidobacteriaceae bacterium]|nr:DUF4126 family protein [Acidobacteriaceae bacterium]